MGVPELAGSRDRNLATTPESWHECRMLLPRLLVLLLAASLAGCASKGKENQLDPKTANSRAIEQRRMRIVTEYADQGVTARGAEIAIMDPEKTFNPSVARFGNASRVDPKTAQVNAFNYEDRVRTREYGTKAHHLKTAWMGDVKFETKAAPVRQSWFSRLTARTKPYGTRGAAMTDKTAATRTLPGGDKPFLVQGRRQADYDKRGPAAQAFGGDRISGESWSGDLKKMTIEDVKQLLNKN
jgi:hypothetical protein